MKILLLGSGGREHALAWKIAQSPKVERLFIAPGNPGTAAVGTNIALDPCDFDAVAQAAIDCEVDMLVVGPEAPLVEGITDYFSHHSLLRDIAVVGPTKAGAMLEGSKNFAKEFMLRHGIPTARHRTFGAGEEADAIAFLEEMRPPYVLKADGLAAGKGVLITPSFEQAKRDLFDLLGGMFGEASKRVVIEEYLEGVECSVFALTDGQHYVLLPEAKDYKRIGEGDTGLNTGGMGSVSPVPFATADWLARVEREIVAPTVAGLAAEGIDYKGFIFFGLMNCADGPKVIEYNCRMGDPETESVMLRLKSDLVELMEAAAAGTLDQKAVAFDERPAACVMCVSGGYPEKYRKGLPMHLPAFEADTIAFHAGTKLGADGSLLTNGGRVLAVSAYGRSGKDAVSRAIKGAEGVKFDGVYFRKDIGQDILK